MGTADDKKMAAPIRAALLSSRLNFTSVGNQLAGTVTSTCGLHTSETLAKYPNWKMVKEVKHRKAVKQYAFERLNINALRKNKIIPPEIKELADAEIAALHACLVFLCSTSAAWSLHVLEVLSQDGDSLALFGVMKLTTISFQVFNDLCGSDSYFDISFFY